MVSVSRGRGDCESTWIPFSVFLSSARASWWFLPLIVPVPLSSGDRRGGAVFGRREGEEGGRVEMERKVSKPTGTENPPLLCCHSSAHHLCPLSFPLLSSPLKIGRAA